MNYFVRILLMFTHSAPIITLSVRDRGTSSTSIRLVNRIIILYAFLHRTFKRKRVLFFSLLQIDAHLHTTQPQSSTKRFAFPHVRSASETLTKRVSSR